MLDRFRAVIMAKLRQLNRTVQQSVTINLDGNFDSLGL
jgi:hypothetical protein